MPGCVSLQNVKILLRLYSQPCSVYSTNVSTRTFVKFKRVSRIVNIFERLFNFEILKQAFLQKKLYFC